MENPLSHRSYYYRSYPWIYNLNILLLFQFYFHFILVFIIYNLFNISIYYKSIFIYRITDSKRFIILRFNAVSFRRFFRTVSCYLPPVSLIFGRLMMRSHLDTFLQKKMNYELRSHLERNSFLIEFRSYFTLPFLMFINYISSLVQRFIKRIK